MPRVLPLVSAIVVVLGSGLAHGLLTDRWSLSKELDASTAKLKDVGLVLGQWEGKDTKPLDAQDLAVGEIAGYLSRIYVNRQTGSALSVLVVCGRPGPIAAHTPEVCFVGSGMDLVKKSREVISWSPSQPPAECFVGQFRKLQSGLPNQRRVVWSMTTDGSWSAPDNPRWTFRGAAALYKFYLVREIPNGEELLENDNLFEFMKVFIPELERVLFSS